MEVHRSEWISSAAGAGEGMQRTTTTNRAGEQTHSVLSGYRPLEAEKLYGRSSKKAGKQIPMVIARNLSVAARRARRRQVAKKAYSGAGRGWQVMQTEVHRVVAYQHGADHLCGEA